MKKRRFVKLALILSNFFFIAVIFSIVFVLIEQLFPLANLSKRIDDEKFYCYNYQKVEDYYSSEEKDLSSYYFIDYIEVDGKYLQLLYLNENALKEGFPFIYQSMIHFYDFEIDDLPKNTILTNRIDLQTENVKYIPYFKDRTIKNYFFNIKLEVPYIHVTEEFSNISLAVYNNYPSVKKASWYNEIWDNSICMEGKALKNNFYRYNEIQMNLFILLSIIPIFFLMIAIGNFHSYYIASEQNIIIIKNIYYASYKKIFFDYFKELIIITSISSVMAISLMWFIFMHKYINVLYTSILCCLLFQALFISFVVKKNVKKNMDFNLWRKIND